MTQLIQLTAKDLKDALPKQMRRTVSHSLLDRVNAILADPNECETFRENIVGLTWILKEGKFNLEQYVNAVRYIQFTLMGKSNIESYSLTFPDRIQKWTDSSCSAKDVSAYVAAYNKGKLVNLVREATQIPAYIYNQDVYQSAINKQVSLMDNPAVSFKVQSDAANSLMTHLKPPETTKVQLDIGVKEDSAVASLKEQVALLAAKQKLLIAGGGMTAQEAAHQKLIIEGDVEHVQ